MAVTIASSKILRVGNGFTPLSTVDGVCGKRRPSTLLILDRGGLGFGYPTTPSRVPLSPSPHVGAYQLRG